MNTSDPDNRIPSGKVKIMPQLKKRVARAIGIAVALVIVPLVQFTAARPALAVEISRNAFVHHHVATGYRCEFNEVMVGVHLGKGKVICAELNFGYQISKTITDPPVGGTQVSSSPSMHGCPQDYLIQAMVPIGHNEELTCVSLRNREGQALTLPRGVHDGRGPDNNGTQSDVYGLVPAMHACPPDLAMRGVHLNQNDLFCAG